MTDYSFFRITDFSPGLNKEYDARALRPYNNEDVVAEATRCENYDIIQKGAIYTAPGYEEVLQLGTGEPTDCIAELDYNISTRYKIMVSDDDVFYLRKADELVVHDMDAHTGGPYGNWTVSDAGSGPGNYPTGVRGSGCVTATINSALSANEYMTMECALTAVDLSSYEYLETFMKLDCRTDGAAPTPVDVFDDIRIRIGTDSSNYYEWTHTSSALGESIPEARWFGLRCSLGSPTTTVGSPDLSNCTYLATVVNFSLALDPYSTTLTVDQFQGYKEASDYSVIDITASNWGNTATVEQKIVNWEQYTGSRGYPYIIFVNNIQPTLKVYNLGEGMLISEQISGAPSNASCVKSLAGFLFINNDRSVHYCMPEDETDWSSIGSGAIKFDAKVMGISATVDDKLLIGTLKDTEAIEFNFDDTNYLYTPVKGKYRAGTGCLSHKSIQQRYNNSIFLSTDGVAYFGQSEEALTDNYVVDSLSWRIDKVIRDANKDSLEGAASYKYGRDKDYGIALPVGVGVKTNNQLYVYKGQYKSWIYRSGISMSCACSVVENEKEEVWFGSPYDDRIYKFNETHDYNGDSYVRRYAFKTFTMGTPALIKRVPYIEVAGAMPFGTEFYVVVRADGVEKTFKITETAILTTSSGGFIGDDVYGSEYYGGIVVGTSPYDFYRLYQRIHLPDDIVEGREYEIEFYYEGTANPHKIDYFGMKYAYMSEAKISPRYVNDNIVPNVIP